ncbi:hypothetical protein [Deinococcus hopiensis]|nr:hypothetical protein [Deinococcus hopiensis]
MWRVNLPDGLTELTLSREAPVPEVGDILIGTTETWEVTEVFRDTVGVRIYVRRT